MAASAYAAVGCLMNTMEQMRNHPHLSASFDNNQIESLGEHLDFLLEYVESYCYLVGASEAVEDLERRIASAAHAAEDAIESHVVDQIQDGFPRESRSLLVDLQWVIEEMSLIKEVAAKVKEEMPEHVQRKPKNFTPAAPPAATMVGYDDEVEKIVSRLIKGSLDREIITIQGMPSTGKTIIAKNVYNNTRITKHFHSRAWSNVSQDYNVREVLLQLLSCLRRSTGALDNLHEDELGQELYKMLSFVQYLIVLDDIRGAGAFEGIKDLFPENNNGSRIIVTTRLPELASCINSYQMQMRFLMSNESWDLLCRVVFGDHSCPRKFARAGQWIAYYCDGIPSLVYVMGAFLRKSSTKPEFWDYVVESLRSIGYSDRVDRFEKTLVFFYNALPTCLKPCFLYMGMFPKYSEIRVSRLIKLWVAEGFLKQQKGYTLEEVGENCIWDLIDRGFITLSSTRSNGEPKTCKMDDSFRALCLRILDKDKFLYFVKTGNIPQEGINKLHRFVLDKGKNPQSVHAMESALLARSLISESPVLVSFKSRLLRVLVEVYSDSLEGSFEQVNLRFFSYESLRGPTDWMDSYELPSSISLLWNVQTLVSGKKMELVVAPSEIWKLHTIMHLDFYRICLPDPPPSGDEDDSVLQNLQTLGTVVNLECSEEVCKRMPNVKKLRVFYDGDGQRRYRYSLFAKLESLQCCFRDIPDRDDLLQNLKFPSSLKKLVLQDCELHWRDSSIIGSLPLLEVLKLNCQSFKGPRWETVEGEFIRLKFLEIDSCYLIYWTAEESHFPVLEKLVLRRLYRLKEIPSKIGEIPTLEEISILECSISAAIAAGRILEEQEQNGGSEFRVRVVFRNHEEVAEFKAKINSDVFKSSRLQIVA